MRIETLGDVLHWTRQVHEALAACLERSSGQQSERGRMVLGYLADHEKQLGEVLGHFEDEASERALKTWVQEYVASKPLALPPCDTDFAGRSADEIMDQVIDQQDQLIDLYRTLQGKADTASARELLEELAALEEHETMRVVQGINRLADI